MLFLLGYLCLVLILLKVYQKWTIGRDDSNLCLIGKTAIITGGNRGIGYETALKFASRGCKVIIADILDSEETVKDIIQQTNNQNVFYKTIDLSSFKSIRKFAKEINQSEEKLDILINNAGCVGFEGVYTDDNILKSHQINYYGPFLLTHLLTDLMKKTTNSRIVFVTSIVCFANNLTSIEDINKTSNTKLKFMEETMDYYNNKLCVLIAAKKFAEKLHKYGISCTSVHPGLVATAIYKTNHKNLAVSTNFMNLVHAILALIVKIYGKTPSEGAQTTLYSALSPDVKKSIGGFYTDCKQYFCLPSLAKNEKFCNELWCESERLTSLKPNEKID